MSQVKETLLLEFYFIPGDIVRVKDDIKAMPHQDWVIGLNLRVTGYMATGDENRDHLSYCCVDSDENTPYPTRMAWMHEDHIEEVDRAEDSGHQ